MVFFITTFLLFSITSIATNHFESKLYNYIKPIPIIMLILLLVKNASQFNQFIIFTLLALSFGLIGDILLLNKKRFFIPGLATFLFGHVFYIINFFTTKLVFPVILILMLTVMTVLYLVYLTRTLITNKKIPLIIPSVLYGIILLVMTIVLINFNLINNFSYMLGLGSLLFFISDICLSYDFLIRRFKFAPFAVLSTYYLAQLLITLYVLNFPNI